MPHLDVVSITLPSMSFQIEVCFNTHLLNNSRQAKILSSTYGNLEDQITSKAPITSSYDKKYRRTRWDNTLAQLGHIHQLTYKQLHTRSVLSSLYLSQYIYKMYILCLLCSPLSPEEPTGRCYLKQHEPGIQLKARHNFFTLLAHKS